MDLNKYIQLASMADSAEKLFNATSLRVENLESSIRGRMNGKSMKGVIGAFFITTLWVVGFCVLLYRAFPYLDEYWFLALSIGTGIFFLIIYIDEIVSYKYFKKIASYNADASRLVSRVRVGKNTIVSKKDEYLQSVNNGWGYELILGDSIPDEAASIEQTMAGIESLKDGVISTLKRILYYALGVLITFVGSRFFFSWAKEQLIPQFGIKSADTAQTACWLILIVACAAEIYLSYFIWSHNDCCVNNKIVWAVLLGPLFFMGLVNAVIIVAYIVGTAIMLVVTVGMIALMVFCLSATTTGG